MCDPIKYFAAIKAKTSCPECGNPVFLNGPTEFVLCSHCMYEMEFKKFLPTDLVETPFKELKANSAKQTSYNCFTYDYSFVNKYPKCPKCDTQIPDEKLIEQEGKRKWEIICEKCSYNIPVVTIPGYIRKKVPHARIAVNALGGIEKKPEASANIEGVVFSCPKCGGALEIDGSDRLVDCTFCASKVYIPDDLWLRLHPVKKAETWYVGYTELARNIAKEKIDDLRTEKKENLKKVKDINLKIRELKEKRNDLGWFKGKEKDQIDSDITKLKLEREKLEENNELIKEKIEEVQDDLD